MFHVDQLTILLRPLKFVAKKYFLLFGELAQWVKIWKFHNWANISSVTIIHCHKPYQYIFNGKKIREEGACYSLATLFNVFEIFSTELTNPPSTVY